MGLKEEKHFDKLRAFLTGQGHGATYAEVAAELGVSEGVVKTKVHRLRKKYGELLRQEIAKTVESEKDVEGELRYLLEIISR